MRFIVVVTLLLGVNLNQAKASNELVEVHFHLIHEKGTGQGTILKSELHNIIEFTSNSMEITLGPENGPTFNGKITLKQRAATKMENLIFNRPFHKTIFIKGVLLGPKQNEIETPLLKGLKIPVGHRKTFQVKDQDRHLIIVTIHPQWVSA